MANCTAIDPLVTSYVDDALDAAARRSVDDHVRVCVRCHARVSAERAVRALLRARHAELTMGCAPPPALRERCSAAARGRDAVPLAAGAASHTRWRSRIGPLAIAASLVLIAGGILLYQLTSRSTRLLAAELTADHVKCFGVLNPLLGTHEEAATVERSIASSFGWKVRLPRAAERAGLELVGARPCLYGEGMVAHIMYRHNGEPVSVFMLPKTTRADEMLDVMGHEASIWSVGNRTFVLIAREPRAEVAQLTSFVQDSFR
jgi:anti-sigma factor RsiW